MTYKEKAEKSLKNYCFKCNFYNYIVKEIKISVCNKYGETCYSCFDRCYLIKKNALNKKLKRSIIMKSKNLYGNHKVYSPGDIFMFRCSFDRINWYLKRDLAEIINVDGNGVYDVRFKFKPKGLGNNGDEFHLSEKEPVCVVCGEKDPSKLTKHHIIPYMFRKFLPDELKNYNSYDVVIICDDHHGEYERHATDLKEVIFQEYGVRHHTKDYKRLQKLSKTLLNYKNRIPKSRIEEIKCEIEEISGLRFNKIKKSQLLEWSEDVNIGEAVVRKIDDYQEFFERWRQHFLDYAKPKFMNEHWIVDKKII